MSRKTGDDKRKDAREYMRVYREHNPPPKEYSQKSNAKRKALLKSLPSKECKCGGTYKNYPQCKQKHLETYKHQAWYAEKNLIKLMVRAGEAKDRTSAKRQLDKRLKTRYAYTDKNKVIAYDQIGENINNIMKAGNDEEEVKPRRKTKETHHEKMIRIAAEQEDEEKDILAEMFPEDNVIIEAQKILPPTPPPSCSEEEEEETEQTESETETPSEGTVSECSDGDEIDDVRQQLERDKEKAIQRFNRFKNAEAVEKESEPNEAIDMSSYLEEASKPTTDGSEILRQLGILKKTKTGGDKYTYV